MKLNKNSIGFPKSTGRESHYETAICYDGEIIHIKWESIEDVSIPENRKISTNTIITVTPNKYRKLLGDECLLELCDKEERRKNG